MRHILVLGLSVLLLSVWCGESLAQSRAGAVRIEWEVKNGFRLFRNEADFQRHVAAYRGDSVLAAEERLSRESDGRGWARDTVERLCTDRPGNLLEFCERDGVREIYLAPRDHRIGAVVAGQIPPDLNCAWRFEDSETIPREATVPCTEEVKLRVVYGRTTLATVDVLLPDGTAQRVVAEIAVRDVLIAGMGDSIAAGEGNPDRPVRLTDQGFCFRRFLGSGASEYFRPGRDGYGGNKACSTGVGEDSEASGDWARQGARWESNACHRSLYSYQMRTALALAVENPQLAVTFIPLGCSGATVEVGFLNNQRIRECASPGTSLACSSTVRAQVAGLTEALATARRHRADRNLDLVLLTIGANDILFSGLIADVIVESTTERVLFGRGGVMSSVAASQKILDGDFPVNFAKVRAALKPFVRGNLARVVFVSYGHPALLANVPCPGGRDGFDVHPGFGVDAGRLRRVADYVSREFLPKIKALATCDGRACRDPATERMTFVESHQAAFANHGVCARSNDDPSFDRECFSAKGESFATDPAVAVATPMACGRSASEFRPYAPRARWVRTANDSYFTAMTYPQGVSLALQPANIHDATWGVLSAVYGGAIHPSAEGHAAMADAALPAARAVLGIRPPETVRSEPLPPLILNDSRAPAGR